MPEAELVADEFDAFDAFERESEEEKARQEAERIRVAASGIVDRLTQLAKEHVQRRGNSIERRWIEGLRAYQGRYPDEVEKLLKDADRSGQPKSRAFVNICRTKTDAWEARLSDLLFPADEKNWGIKPTPVPELTDKAERAALEAMQAAELAEQKTQEANEMAAQGQDPSAVLESADTVGAAMLDMNQAAAAMLERIKEAQKCAENMSKEIEDQLSESRFAPRSRDCIRDGVRLGVGVMKGPVTGNRPRRRWQQVEVQAANDGGQPVQQYKLEDQADSRPEARRVDPWHFFPDDNATAMEEAEFTFERYLPTRRELKRLARTLGFDPEAVRQIVADGTGFGTQDDFNHLNELRQITGEGEAVKDRYVMWEYNGPLECEEICSLLAASGRHKDADEWRKETDPLKEHMVTMFFCNGHLLKLAEDYLLDSGENLYSVFSFSPSEASIMGARGVPSLMLDSLKALNAAWRMMLDNAALSVAPQVVVDKSQVEPEDKNWKMSAGKVWVRIGQDMPRDQKPFETFNIPINQAQIQGIIELALKFIDEETSLPMIAQGEQGSHITQTMGGMTMLFNSANVVFRRVVKNWDDDMTTPMIRRFYDWNMQFNQKEELKGDMQIDARGTSFLLVREFQSQNLMQIAMTWSQHPLLGPMVKMYGTGRMAIQSLGISPDDILETEEQFKKNMAAMSEGGAESPDVIRAQATIEAAKISAESRKLDGETQLQVANMHRETELIKLALQEKLGVDQLKAMLTVKKMETDSKERVFASEVAIQDQARRTAIAAGVEPPAGGGGYV